MEILLLGACELLILKVPPHAAVDAANRLAAGRWQGGAFQIPDQCRAAAGGARRRKRAQRQQDGARLDTPDWLWTRWSAQYGERCRPRHRRSAQPRKRRWTSRLKNRRQSHSRKRGVGRPVAARVGAEGRVEDMPGFAEGGWWVQDVAATLPVAVAGRCGGQARDRSLRRARRQDIAAGGARRRRHRGRARCRARGPYPRESGAHRTSKPM